MNSRSLQSITRDELIGSSYVTTDSLVTFLGKEIDKDKVDDIIRELPKTKDVASRGGNGFFHLRNWPQSTIENVFYDPLARLLNRSIEALLRIYQRPTLQDNRERLRFVFHGDRPILKEPPTSASSKPDLKPDLVGVDKDVNKEKLQATATTALYRLKAASFRHWHHAQPRHRRHQIRLCL